MPQLADNTTPTLSKKVGKRRRSRVERLIEETEFSNSEWNSAVRPKRNVKPPQKYDAEEFVLQQNDDVDDDDNLPLGSRLRKRHPTR